MTFADATQTTETKPVIGNPPPPIYTNPEWHVFAKR